LIGCQNRAAFHGWATTDVPTVMQEEYITQRSVMMISYSIWDPVPIVMTLWSFSANVWAGVIQEVLNLKLRS